MIVDPGFERTIAFARDLIRIPGLSGEEREVAERVRDEMTSLGYDDVQIDDAGSVIGRVRGGPGEAIMLSCHLDAVDVGDPAAWQHGPFDADIDDEFLYGRGAMDIKGPLAIQTHAAAHFLADRLPGDLWVAHTVYEERGGWGMERLLEAGAVRPAAVIIGESTNGDVCIGHRGRAEVIVEIEGVAGHASAPERAANPLALLSRVIPALERFAAALPSDAVLGASTLAPTMVETLPRSRNVIPDRVRITCDWRVLPDMTSEQVVATLEDFLARDVQIVPPYRLSVRAGTELQRSWTGLAEERRLFTPGFLSDPDNPVVTAAASAVALATGRVPNVRPWTFATDGGHSCGVHGIPTLGYAPGEERYAHTNRERLALADARTAYNAYPSLIRAVMDAVQTGTRGFRTSPAD
jgi:putative selenium metabolism hydrolase